MIDYNLKTWERVTELLKQSEYLYEELLIKEMEQDNGQFS